MNKASGPSIRLGNRLASAATPYVIAEAGVHHYNSIEKAKALTLAAAQAGADAIKFQTYRAERLVTTWAPIYWNDDALETQFDLFKDRARLSPEAYWEIFEHARGLGIEPLSTPFDTDAVDLLAELEMVAYKIASADLTDWPLLEKVAGTDRPMVLSTGASTLEEIQATAELLDGLGADYALLHCNLSYPTPVAEANLGRIGILREAFPEILIGYSDHTRYKDTRMACPAAVGLGAGIIEKHFTLNDRLPGDDHDHAVDPAGLARMVRDCADMARMVADPRILTDSEAEARKYARRSIVAARDLPAGHVLTAEDMDCKRPGTGLAPTHWQAVLGRKLAAKKGADDLILLEDLQD